MKYSDYKESQTAWMGMIPATWRTERAKWHFTLRNERGNQTPVLLAATQKYGMFPQEMIEGVVKVAEGTDVQQFRTVHKGDFVISLRSFQGGFERSDYEGVCSPAYQVFYADDNWNKDYLKFLFKNELFVDAMNALTVGIREGRNIKYEDFANTVLAIPPLADQEAIAAYLDSKTNHIDSVIEEARASIDEYKQWKASIIYEAVTKGLDPDVEMVDSGVEWIGKMPKGWKCTALKNLCSMQSGRNITSEQIADEGDYPVYGGNGIRGYYSEWNTEGEFLTVGRQGALCGNVHKVSGRVWATEHAVVTRSKEGVSLPYLYYNLVAMNLNQYASNTAAQPGLAVGAILTKQTIIPPVEEQQLIGKFLDKKCSAIDALIGEKELLISDLEAYKKSLIFEVVTGKRKVV